MKTLLIFLLLGYNAWLVFCLLREKQQKEKSQPKDITSPLVKPPQKTDDIVGKSLFQMKMRTPTTAISTPQAATSVESEDVTDIAVTFVDEKEEPSSARLPDDKLDEAFTDIRISDVPQEYAQDDEKDEVPAGRYAIGNSFEEIGEAVSIADNPAATEKQRRHAGQLFSEMEGDDLFNRLTERNTERAKKIMGLMDFFFSRPISGERQTVEKLVQPQTINGIPNDINEFDIRDFV